MSPPDASAPVEEPGDDAEFAAAPDADRLLRLRLVFAAATLLVGSLFSLFAFTVILISFSGSVSLVFGIAATLLAVGVIALLPRALLRALSAWRPQSDELRSAAGLTSLLCGGVLLAADAAFLMFTVSVLLTFGGASALFIIPLAALLYATYQFIREATDDFRKTVRLRRETLLFLTSLGYLLFLFFVFVTLAAASIASPVTLKSPAINATICPGTVLDFEVNALGTANATWDSGAGPRPLNAPFDVDTTGWAPGPYNVTVTVFDNAGRSHQSVFPFNLSASRPPCA